MPNLTYPASLPCPQTARYAPLERRQMGTPERPREARALQRDRGATETATWPPLTTAQFETLMDWWRGNLVFGGAWFAATWPSPQGRVALVRKFIQQPRRTFMAGGFWRVTAMLEVRGVGELPQLLGPLILLRFNGDQGSTFFRDEGSAEAVWTTDGTSAYLSTAQFIDGRSSLYLNGDGTRIATPYNAGVALTDGDFTIEFWVRPDSNPLDGRTWLGITNPGNFTAAWQFYTGLVGGAHPRKMSFFWKDSDEVESFVASSVDLSPTVWTHIAATRRADRVSLWQDGVEVAFMTGFTGSIADPSPANSMLTIGKIATNTENPGKIGHIDMVRVFRGLALYTHEFTPPRSF